MRVKILRLSALLSVSILFFCCVPGQISKNSVPAAEKNREDSVNSPSRQPAGGNPTIILTRGNNWIRGIPGFGINGFPALTGDYKIDGLDFEFSVYVTMEQLFFTDEWQAKTGLGNLEAYKSSQISLDDDEQDLIAVLIEDGRDFVWTAVFRFPEADSAGGPDEVLLDRMIRVWAARLSYFLFLSDSPQNLSLPGALEF